MYYVINRLSGLIFCKNLLISNKPVKIVLRNLTEIQASNLAKQNLKFKRGYSGNTGYRPISFVTKHYSGYTPCHI